MVKKLCDYELIELLDVRSVFENTPFSVSEIFDAISVKMMKEYQIKKGSACYDFLELEFYYFDANHRDLITYPRSLDAGRWFFHSSGVDISFKSICENKFSTKNEPKENFFGGILIRSLLKQDKGEVGVITGPLKCCWELFDHFNAFSISLKEFPVIEQSKVLDGLTVYKTARHFGPTIKDPDYHSRPYRCYVKHPSWIDYPSSKYNARPWRLESEEVLI